MRLFEAIVEANHRALRGDATAGLRASEFAESLPIVALTCIDARLNRLMPEVLGVSEEHFIWLRSAGNIITGAMSSTMRSLALACVIKGGQEIAIIGHTDCRVCKTTVLELTERFRALGVARSQLPDNLTEFFGLFASESQNVIKGVEFARRSPLLGPRIPVHGLLVDIISGRLDWIVNGYQAVADSTTPSPVTVQPEFTASNASVPSALNARIGALNQPESKIGNIASFAEQVGHTIRSVADPEPVPENPPEPMSIPMPPPIRPTLRVKGKNP